MERPPAGPRKSPGFGHRPLETGEKRKGQPAVESAEATIAKPLRAISQAHRLAKVAWSFKKEAQALKRLSASGLQRPDNEAHVIRVVHHRARQPDKGNVESRPIALQISKME